MSKELDSSVALHAVRRAVLIACVLGVTTTLFESIAGVGGRARLIDLTGAFIERPFWILLFGVWAVWVVRRLHASSWTEAIERVTRYAPLLFLVPVINVVLAWVGFELTVPSFVNVLEAPVSLLTFGWLPRLLASPGTLTLLLVSACVGMMDARAVKRPIKDMVQATLLWLFGSLGLLLLPSMTSWALVSTELSPLNAGPNVLARVWTALSQEGYWWRSILDRFPGVLEGEADASVRLLRVALAFVFSVVVGSILFFRNVPNAFQQIRAWAKPARALSFFMAAWFGLLIGATFGGALFVRAIDGVALLLFMIALIATWGVSVWRNDLHDREADATAERMRNPPLQGIITPYQLAFFGKTLLVVACISGWFLGWPVLLSLLAFLSLQEVLAMPDIRWKDRMGGGLVLAGSFVCVATAGIFFSLRTASVPILPSSIWLMVSFFYLFQAVPKALRWSPALLEWLTKHLRVPPRMLIPIALSLSYLVVPLLSGWMIIWWIALPCAIVALLPLLGGGRWDEQKIVGWQTAFLLILSLLLAVRPSP